MRGKGGRPKGSTKLNVKIIADIRESLLQGVKIKEACALAGVSYSSFYNWRMLGVKRRKGIYRTFFLAVEPIFREKERLEKEKYHKKWKLYLARLELRNPELAKVIRG